MNVDDSFQRLLACLSDASRYRVLTVIAEGDRCVSEIAERVGLSQSCTTRHLQALQRAGVLRRERQGKRVVFRIEASDVDRRRVLEWVLLRGAPAAPEAVVADRVSLGGESGQPAPRPQQSRLPVAVRRRRRAAARPARESDATATAPSVKLPAPEAPEGAPPRPLEDQIEDYLL